MSNPNDTTAPRGPALPDGSARDEAAPRAVAALALSCLDLTNLSEVCDAAQIEALCARARTPHGDVAAICIWPRFVARARALLGPANPIRIATVVNFPGGSDPLETTLAETRAALAAGADEIDLVVPYRALLAGQPGAIDDTVAAVRAATTGAVLKTILETGILAAPDAVAEASRRAIAAGADFLKTSTGKVPVNATPEAAAVMLRAIRESGRPVGFKAAGGIGSVAVAAVYLDRAAAEMGPGWARPSTLRFGASGLLDDILAVLGGGTSAGTGSGY